MSMPIFPILITATVHHTINFSQNVDAFTQGVPGQIVQYLMILKCNSSSSWHRMMIQTPKPLEFC